MSSALVLHESIYGNTRAVAEAIAEGLGDTFETTVAPIHEADIASLDAIHLLGELERAREWGQGLAHAGSP